MDGYMEQASPYGVDGRNPLWSCPDCGTRADGDVVILTADALDALPYGSVVLDASSDVYEAHDDASSRRRRWFTTGDEGLNIPKLPATLLHVGRLGGDPE